MRKIVVHASGQTTPLTGVTLGQVAYFVQMYPQVHIFLLDDKVLESEPIFEDIGMDAFFGEDPI